MPGMRRPALLLVCLCVVLAGCSMGGTPTDAGTATGTATGTPVGELTEESAPPGVDAESGELTDANALLDAHADRLVAAGFVTDVRSNATILRNGEPTQVRRQQLVRVEPGASEYNNTVLNPGSRFDVWGNESVQAVRLRAGGGVRYDSGPPQSGADLTGQGLLARYLATGGWTVTNVSVGGGETLFTLRSTTLPSDPSAVPANATDVRDYAAVVVVDGDGRVRYFETTGTYTLDGNEGTFTVSQRLVSLGDPGVERPAWVSEAL